MAKFRTTTIAVALFFCLFTLSIAGDATENDESTAQVSLPLSEAAIRLPSAPVNTETESNSAAVPLTKIEFHPVNRRFRVRSGHPCRHHFKFYHRVNGEIPYGNDMLVSTGEKSNLRRIRGRWAKMHHHQVHHDQDSDSDDDEDDDRLKKLALKRNQKKLRLHFLSGKEEKKKGGFMKRVRKFLENYF